MLRLLNNIKLRYHLYKKIQSDLFIIRFILKEMNIIRNDLRNSPGNNFLNTQLINMNKELDKYKAAFGHSVLHFIGEFGPLQDDGFGDLWKDL
mgnify:CR=1 FL=1